MDIQKIYGWTKIVRSSVCWRAFTSCYQFTKELKFGFHPLGAIKTENWIISGHSIDWTDRHVKLCYNELQTTCGRIYFEMTDPVFESRTVKYNSGSSSKLAWNLKRIERMKIIKSVASAVVEMLLLLLLLQNLKLNSFFLSIYLLLYSLFCSSMHTNTLPHPPTKQIQIIHQSLNAIKRSRSSSQLFYNGSNSTYRSSPVSSCCGSSQGRSSPEVDTDGETVGEPPHMPLSPG